MSQATVVTGAPRAADRLVAGVEVLGLAAGDHDRRAEAGELERDRLAEPGAAAGDEHRRAVERAGGQRAGAELGGLGQARQVGGHGSLQLPV